MINDKLVFYSGDNPTIYFTIKDIKTKEPKDISNYSFTFTIKDRLGRNLLIKNKANGIYIEDQTDPALLGKGYIRIGERDFFNIDGAFSYDFEIAIMRINNDGFLERAVLTKKKSSISILEDLSNA